MQRRTAALLGPLEHEGYLVLHDDVTLPGWLDSLDHVVVGPTGVWVVASCRRRRLLGGGGAVPAGILRGLRAQATGWPRCWTAGPRSRSGRCCACAAPGWEPLATLKGTWLADPRRLANLVRSGSRVAPGDIDQAAARLLKVLRAAA